MILAVPALGIIRIMLSYSTHLKSVVILIEDTPIEKPSEENTEPTNP
jgi:hypothetical protein